MNDKLRQRAFNQRVRETREAVTDVMLRWLSPLTLEDDTLEGFLLPVICRDEDAKYISSVKSLAISRALRRKRIKNEKDKTKAVP